MIGNAVKAGAKGPEVDRLIADLSYASGDYAGALPRYLQLLVGKPSDGVLYERAGLSAMQVRDVAQAEKLLERATTFPTATWRAWNARGIAADYRGDWAVADESYARALALAPDRPEVVNNLGWSLLARGRWAEALANFERAAAMDPKSARIAANLELARAAMSEDLPQAPRRARARRIGLRGSTMRGLSRRCRATIARPWQPSRRRSRHAANIMRVPPTIWRRLSPGESRS